MVNGKLTDYLRGRITDSQYGYKHYYGNSFSLKEFVPSDEPATVESSDDPWTSNDIEDPFGDTPSKTTTSTETSSPFEEDNLFG